MYLRPEELILHHRVLQEVTVRVLTALVPAPVLVPAPAPEAVEPVVLPRTSTGLILS